MAEKKMSFEQSIKRLEEIVVELEGGKTSLEYSLKLFEEGTKLLGKCTTMLDTAEQKVTTLLQSTEE